ALQQLPIRHPSTLPQEGDPAKMAENAAQLTDRHVAGSVVWQRLTPLDTGRTRLRAPLFSDFSWGGSTPLKEEENRTHVLLKFGERGGWNRPGFPGGFNRPPPPFFWVGRAATRR